MKNFIRENKFLLTTIALVMIVALLLLYPINYYVVSPGIAKAIAPMVKVEGQTYPTEGEIMLTTVSMKQANLIDYAWIKLFNPELRELQSMDFLPKNVKMEEYFELMEEMMKESQLKAQAVALDNLGYQPQITGGGVKIVQVLEKSNGYGRLKEGDIIVAVDGEEVQLITETVDKIQNRDLGATAQVTVKRETEKKTFKIKTKALKENSTKPSIGVLITPYRRQYDFPIKININAGKIGGPSAGSMFTLEIYNQLTTADITKGVKIAGTGTISLDGSIGAIDGIRQKIAAAEQEGAKIFFVPAGNWKAAKKFKDKKIKLVKVAVFSEIINYLKNNSLETI
ncbi:MAG: YlbL family protein [Bacillota bacterium]